MNVNEQPLLRLGHRSPVGSVPKRHQRCATPTAVDLGEEPVLNGVELGTIRRVMHDKKPYIQFIGEVHQILLDDSVRTGVEPPPSHKMTRVRAVDYCSFMCLFQPRSILSQTNLEVSWPVPRVI